MPPCAETSGFLFPHPCGRPGGVRCVRCARLVCLMHARPQALEQFLCVSCARAGADPSDADDWDAGDDDPYFYSARYRARSGGGEPDPMDFTEGDQALFDAGEAGAFEDDMGGS